MIRTYSIILMFVLFCAPVMAQNMQILYDFDALPQTLLLNPGSEVDFDRHFGVPLLSNIYMDLGSSDKDVSYNSVISGSDGLGGVMNKMYDLGLKKNDVFVFNQQIELFNIGFRLKDPRYYLSFGMYQQIDGFTAYPPDVANLFVKGNDQDGNGIPESGQVFAMNDLNSVGELVGVFHVGINKKVNDKLTAGLRLKFMSGSLGLETKSNQGDYYLTINPLTNEPYLHNYENMKTVFNSSGVLNSFDLSSDVGEIDELISGLFFIGGSAGMALDMGFTYKVTDEITVSGSALDLGALKFNHKLTKIDIENKQIASAIYYDPFEGNELDYWQSLYVAGLLPMKTSETAYTQLRSPKLNGSARYNMKRKVKPDKSAFRNVRGDLSSDFLISSFGMQVYTEFRPNYPLWAVTAFYSRELTHYLNTKVTYTVDRFSATNIGLGASVHVKSFNFYTAIDNLLALPNIKNSNYQSFQFGMNFIFK